jgi:putative Mg2+ transporter-C (MgtC) family protein
MDPITDELFRVPAGIQTLTVIVRVLAAGVLGAVIGAERESEGKAAGLRTHILVSLGAALFVISPRLAGVPTADLSRVVQGVAAGVGFIGAGTILKMADREQITGLTTAASVWMTAGVGISAGIAPLWVPILCTACAWTVLYVFARFERAGD